MLGMSKIPILRRKQLPPANSHEQSGQQDEGSPGDGDESSGDVGSAASKTAVDECVSSSVHKTGGLTNRVAKLLQFMRLDVPSVVGLSDEENWRLEKKSLESELAELREMLARAETDHKIEHVYVEVGRPAVADSLQEELELLRLGGQQKPDKKCENLRKIVAELTAENAQLRDRIAQMRQATIDAPTRPPLDLNFSKISRVPLQMDENQQELVFQVLQKEWDEARENSRHALAAPLKNPFDRRRFAPGPGYM